MAEEPRRVTLEDYSSSIVPQFFTSIAQPEVQAQTITYPPSLIQLILNNLFHGLPNEDPYAHLAAYIELLGTEKSFCNVVIEHTKDGSGIGAVVLATSNSMYNQDL